TNRYWLTNMVRADQEEKDLGEMMNLEEKLDQLTSAGIQEVAQKYLDENYFLGILMPEKE
ncbi:hypothetical protein, partial [Muriicola sp.]|uniref:hypothetical protein n=1 Tax=Muriicola sp. TaxID=2020856 RepID=UPI003564EFA5